MENEKILAFESALARLPIDDPQESDFATLCPHLNKDQVQKIMGYEACIFSVPDLNNENGYIILSWSLDEEPEETEDLDNYDGYSNYDRVGSIVFAEKVEIHGTTILSSISMFNHEAMDFAKKYKTT